MYFQYDERFDHGWWNPASRSIAKEGRNNIKTGHAGRLHQVPG